MPARKRHKQVIEHPDPVVRFGQALEREQRRLSAEQERIRAEREEAARLAAIAADHAERLARARARLDRAIGDVKRHRGRADVESEYRVAKAAVVELETGDRPAWAPGP
ncbi:MAG: hypothetical protein ABIP17_12225 [Ilumatobacteraceae bacterium]